VDPATGEVLVAANEYISDDMAEKIEKYMATGCL
jgi:hypothetical protein